ncbi:hypothetical protein BJX96DRAFT_146999 [Aspergillus floccosus]
MIQRMNTDGLEKHLYAALSSECHRRILIAYLDDNKLVIHKSKIYRFHGGNRESCMLFLTYLAAKEGPEDTTTLLSKGGTHTS